MSRRSGRVSDIFGSPAVAPRSAAFSSPAPVREDVKIIPEERKQINLILAELRKELGRMEQDDWKFPVSLEINNN